MTKGDSVNDIFTCLDGIRANIFDEYVTSLGLKAPIFASVGVTSMMPKDLGKTLTD
mgnify:CR=1 FL=1